MTKWTDEQQGAIAFRNGNLLVSAAAGSGKTAVLVERIIQLILNRETRIDQMLIVTYTNAAASEMRARIESALSKAIELDDAQAEFLDQQIKALSRASIKTFHAFCLDVIRSHFQAIDCDPGFKMLSEPERAILMKQAMDETLESAFEAKDPVFLGFIEAYSGNRNDDKVVELISQLHSFILSQPEPDVWLNTALAAYETEGHPIRGSWWAVMKQSFIMRLESAIDLIDYAKSLCILPGGPEAYLKTLESDQQGLARLLEDVDQLGVFANRVLGFNFDRIASIKKDEKASLDEALIEEVKDVIRDKLVKKMAFEPIKKFFEYKDMTRFEEELPAIGTALEALISLTQQFVSRFQAIKRKQNVMDFSDLEHYAIAILKDDTIAAHYQKQFDYLFVDEYQDASGLQEFIINRIKRDHNVFMVGDVKQSIYKFRLADPELFIEKYKRFKKWPNHGTSTDVRIDLKRNFRTRDSILEVVNEIFLTIMSEALGEIDYDEDAQLYPGAVFSKGDKPPVAIRIIEKSGDDADDDADDDDDTEDDEATDAFMLKMKSDELEALAMTDEIKRMIGSPIFHPKTGEFAPCRYRDIVVLLRSTKSWTPTFEQVFLESGIPLFADSNAGYLEALEIKWVLSYLKVIDNPMMDIALITVMRSPFAGFSIEEIAAIKILSPDEKTYYQKCLAIMNSEVQTPLITKVKALIDAIHRYKDWSHYLPVDDLLWKMFSETGFMAYVAVMPGGSIRSANVSLLIDRASALRGSNINHVGQFIQYIEKMTATSGDYGMAKTLGEADDVVRLMSIHKSKGLEFPVVMIGGLGRKFNFMDAQGDLLLHKSLGIGLSIVDLSLRTKSKSLGQMAIREQLKRETLSEEMRVLYVGLTRPVDQLTLFATVSDANKKWRQWQRGTDFLTLSSATGFIDWIMPPILGHPQVDVQVVRASRLAQQRLLHDHHATQTIFSADQVDEAYYQSVAGRLAFRPKMVMDQGFKPLKISVSDRVHAHQESAFGTIKVPALVPLPDFMQTEKTLTPAELGTAIHKVFERMDFRLEPRLFNAAVYLSDLKDRGILSTLEASKINLKCIEEFVSSTFYERIRASLRVSKETPFVLMDEGQMVQGVIDLYFEEADGIVLVDYKSDNVYAGNMEEIAAYYRPQVELYEKALVKLTAKQVKEKYIYFIQENHAYRLV